MRYIIIDPEEGVFLGTVNSPAKQFLVPLFSSENSLEITRACSWSSIKSATTYMNTHMMSLYKDAFVAEVQSSAQFVNVIDILKSGYGEYAHGMINALPMYNINIH
jgi:hypothetical protein